VASPERLQQREVLAYAVERTNRGFLVRHADVDVQRTRRSARLQASHLVGDQPVAGGRIRDHVAERAGRVQTRPDRGRADRAGTRPQRVQTADRLGCVRADRSRELDHRRVVVGVHEAVALGDGHALKDVDSAVVERVRGPVDEQQLLFDSKREVGRGPEVDGRDR
jgi:hypothetical protein